MLTFKINEIPEGKSTETVKLNPSEIDLSPNQLVKGDLIVNFDKSKHIIQIHFEVDSQVLLTCDRSLEQFEQPINSAYSVIYDATVNEVSEDEKTTIKPLANGSNEINIQEEVRDTILLKVPLKKLHPKFLDEDGNETEFSFTAGPENSDDATDPRWEKLKQLKRNLN